MSTRQPGTILILTQVFPPDPAAVGQYMADAAFRLAEKGLDVQVLTANRGYEDPSVKFVRRELVRGVRIRRLPLSSSGKSSLTRRLVGQISFVIQCAVRGLFMRDVESILCTTSPPFGAATGLLVGALRRIPVHFWVMDVNPDQAVASGQVEASSVLARSLEWLNRRVLRQAATVISLDRFMEERLRAKLTQHRARLEIVPPWPLDHHISPSSGDHDWFRRQHGFEGKRVVMYSGNHSPVHPLATLLDAAKRMADSTDLVFVFIGGGLEKRLVHQAIAEGATNIVSLSYQPLETLSASLSAADVHVVALGDDMRGIVHPSKIYNAMLVARPVLYFGPEPSHVTDLLDAAEVGWRVAHGDDEEAFAVLTDIANADADRLRQMGTTARRVVLDRFDPTTLSRRLCDIVAPDRP